MQKCQQCASPATLHITEVLGQGKFEEHHLCEGCATKYLNEAQGKTSKPAAAASAVGGSAEDYEGGGFGKGECSACGIKFVDFRNSGRLGCPHDYEFFRDDLIPLLENIHGDSKHTGKTPRRRPQRKEAETELANLRQKLKTAVSKEDYEEAAKIRDRIKKLEEA
ncbi:MAG: UvrB/UvrC motif-containing protein [Gemmataceae bacterium]